MSTSRTLFIAPTASATLSGEASIRLLAVDGAGTLSGYTLKLNGITLPSVTLDSGVYRLVLDTRRYANGGATLRAEATHSVVGAVYQELTITLDNTLQTGVKYFTVKEVNDRAGYRFTAADVGLKTFHVPDSNRLRYWTQARLLTDTIAGMPDVNAIEPTDMDGLAGLWALGQPVTLDTGKATTAFHTREESLWRYASEQLLGKPGQTAYFMLREEPVEYTSWYETGYERIQVIKRSPATQPAGTEVWHVLARNNDLSGAALFKFTVSGTLAAPDVSLVKIIDMDTLAPEAIDFAVVGSKVYVVRVGVSALRVFDLDNGDAILDLGIVGETRLPAFVENCGGTPILVCRDDELGSNRSRGYDLTFERPRLVWTINETVTFIRYAFSGAGVLGIAAGVKLYTSAAGTGTPTLNTTFSHDITALGASAPNAATVKTYVGLSDGSVMLSTLAGWQTLTYTTDAVTAVSAWLSDGDTERGVAGIAGDTLTEQGLDNLWGAGETLTPPEELSASVAGVTVLQGFERVVTPATGTFGQPGFVPAVVDYRLLVGTGNDGLLATIQRSALNEAAGAFLCNSFDEVYLVGLPDVTPVT